MAALEQNLATREVLAVVLSLRAVEAGALFAVQGIEVGSIPKGAFYLFPSVSGLFGRKAADGKTLRCALDVASYLLNEAGVAVVPGEAFGEERCVRISYATSFDRIEQGAARIAAAVEGLR